LLKNLVILFYNQLELYPPSLHAVELLSAKFEHIHIVSLEKQPDSLWQYPKNVKHHYSKKGIYKGIRKYKQYKDYIVKSRKIIKDISPIIVLVYDGPTLGLTYFFRKTLSRANLVWYHNHDLFEKSFIPTFSFTNCLRFLEKKQLKNIHVLSVPARERLSYFPKYSYKSVIIPNYPLLKATLKGQFRRDYSEKTTLKVIYQGSVSKGHGLEELLNYLATRKLNDIELTIIGSWHPNFYKNLINIITKKNIGSIVELKGRVPYEELEIITDKHDVGWAVNLPLNQQYRTGGSASNKIYEYCSSGLATIYFASDHYDQYLGKMKWAIGTDLSEKNLESVFLSIKENLFEMKECARHSHLNEFNYNNVFLSAFHDILLHASINRIKSKHKE